MDNKKAIEDSIDMSDIDKVLGIDQEQFCKDVGISTSSEKKVNCNFDIVGQIEAKEKIKILFEVFMKNDISQQLILLEGNPGTGKSTLINRIIQYYRIKYPKTFEYKFIDSSDLTDGVKSAEKINKFFNNMETSKRKKILFIDEIDELCSSRKNSQHIRYERSTSMIKGFNREIHNLIVFAATNRPKIIDRAIIDRFTKRIHCYLPNNDEILEICKIHLSKYLDNSQIKILHNFMINDKYQFWTGRDIFLFAKNLETLQQYNEISRKNKTITAEDLCKEYSYMQNGKRHLKDDYLED